MRLTLSTRNVPAVVRQLRAYDTKAKRAIKDVVGQAAAREYARAYDLCSKDTHFMADHLLVSFTPAGYGYELGWRESDFTAAGLAFYPVYQEFGFRHHLSGQFIQNPCLFPARNENRPRFERELRRVLREAARRRG